MRALIVDDTKNDRILLSTLLKSAGFDIIEACNGFEALEQVGKEIPDIIISDVMMPQMDGFMLLRNLKKESKTKAIPFVLYTASYESNEDKELGLSLGASRYIIKPIEPGKFIGEIKSVMKEFELRKIPAPEPEITDEEYLKKYGQRVSLKLESKIKKLEEEIQRRKDAETALLKSERMLNEAQQISHLGSWELDIVKNKLIWSDEVYRIFELDQKTFAATYEAFLDAIHPQDREYVDKSYKDSLKNKKQYDIFHRLLMKDGTIKYVNEYCHTFYDDKGDPIRSIGTIQDITERKIASDALKEAELRYRTLFEQSPDGVLILDPQTAMPIMFNDAACKQLGYSPDEFSRMHVWEYEARGTPEEAKSYIERILREGWADFETQHRTRSGEMRDVLVTSKKIELAGKIVFNVIFRDITERKQAENLRLEKERLEYASKAKSEFLASMSHELRTPLNAILGFSELMKQGIAGKLNEKQEHYVENILSSGKFLLNLINDILDLSKVEAGKIELVIERISLPLILEETTTLIKERAARRKVKIKKELSPELEFIDSDKQRFKQVLFNLLDNAIKFSKPEGGIITITTKKAGDNVEISVSDEGIGIKPADIDKLFQKFQQINPEISGKYGGTGLGLAICKQIVELHGGKIWANSKYGEGSRFTFMLPLKGIKVANI